MTRSCVRSRHPDYKAMAKNRILYGLFLLAAVVFHSFYTGWFSFFLLMFALLLPVFSLLISLPGMLHASDSRKCLFPVNELGTCEKEEFRRIIFFI